MIGFIHTSVGRLKMTSNDRNVMAIYIALLMFFSCGIAGVLLLMSRSGQSITLGLLVISLAVSVVALLMSLFRLFKSAPSQQGKQKR